MLEVGAGIGANTPFLDYGSNGRWVCLEPDPQLAAILAESLDGSAAKRGYEVVCGTISGLNFGETFDTIIYIDVLEHIDDDRRELEAAASRLRAGGRMIVLAPAHQWLFTPFDAAIGHFRRYNKRMIRAIGPECLRLERLFYLDSAGLALSLGNRLLLRQSTPTKSQLRFWDTFVIPISRVLDRCLLNRAGKSIVAVWRRDD